MRYKIKRDDVGRRLDTVLAGRFSNYSRSQIKKLIDSGQITVSSGIKRASYRVRAGDEIDIRIRPAEELSAAAQEIPLDILFEDRDIIIVNKPAGMVVHPAAGNRNGTLVNALLYHCRDLSGIGGVLRPGIVHRLDKGTSGVMVVAKNDAAHLSLSNQFKARNTEKIYLAIIYGVPGSDEGLFDLQIGRHPADRKRMSTRTRRGRDSITRWRVIEKFGRHISYVRIELLTGRTHQVRVHFSAAGMPLVGDMVYGGKKTIKRLPDGSIRDAIAAAGRPMLHASSISFSHPRSGERVRFTAELPSDFVRLLEELRGISY